MLPIRSGKQKASDPVRTTGFRLSGQHHLAKLADMLPIGQFSKKEYKVICLGLFTICRSSSGLGLHANSTPTFSLPVSSPRYPSNSPVVARRMSQSVTVPERCGWRSPRGFATLVLRLRLAETDGRFGLTLRDAPINRFPKILHFRVAQRSSLLFPAVQSSRKMADLG